MGQQCRLASREQAALHILHSQASRKRAASHMPHSQASRCNLRNAAFPAQSLVHFLP